MFFTLEALKAKHGDALLLHHGSAEQPMLWVIDGGPSGVYRASLEPRLRELKKLRSADSPLSIRMLMVSHIDDDHIRGVLDLTNRLREQREQRRELDYRIQTLWHNSFDDVVGDNADALLDIPRPAVTGASAEQYASAMMVASVPQGRELRNNAKVLGLGVNEPVRGVLAAAEDGAALAPPLASDLETRILAPQRKRIVKFQQSWDKELVKRGLAQQPDGVSVAAYLDRSVFNLASIVVSLRVQDREMLLTGDARGDDILDGLAAGGLLDTDGKRHVDLLKLPHHGSDRNVSTDFFRRVTADHYLISGDGGHGNPELATFEMLFAARRDDDRGFALYLTYAPEEFRAYQGKAYPVAELRELFAEARRAGQRFDVITPTEQALSLKIDLLDKFPQ